MSLHLGSSKYDEHTVRKVISKWYLKYLHPLCSICFPGHWEHAGLEDKARAMPGLAVLLSAQPPPATTPSHCRVLSCLAQHCSWRQHPRPVPSRSHWESADVPPGEHRCPAQKVQMSHWNLERHGAGDAASSMEGGTAPTASAGKAQAESSPLSTITPKTSVKPLLSPWILPLFTCPAHFH